MASEGMVLNTVEINCDIINTARMFAVEAEYGSLATYLRGFTGDEVVRSAAEARSIAGALSADMKRRGCKFAGPATAYGLMHNVAGERSRSDRLLIQL